jgi:cytochrome c5
MNPDPHSSAIKSPKQLIVVVVLSFLVPITLIVLISQLVISGHREAESPAAESRVLERIRPVGQVVLAQGAAAQGASAQSTTGTAPQGTESGSPGGVPSASSGVASASAGASPPTASAASTPAPGAPATAAPPPSGPAQPAVAATATAAAKPDGKAVFEQTCHVCHGPGIAGAPKFGDKAAWAPRLAEGIATLHQHAIHGFQGKSGLMPPKGGNAALTDAQVEAAVDYMAAAAK